MKRCPKCNRNYPTNTQRFCTHDGGMLMFGTSFNGLGLKQSLVVALGEDIRASVAATFDADWQRATPL